LLLQQVLPNQIQHLVAQARTDEVLFANVFLGMPLHYGQIRFFRNGKKKINILTPANRYGKTVIPAIRHIHKNYYKIGIGTGNYKGWFGQEYRTANLAPQSAMTEACFLYTKQILESRFPIPQPDGSVKNNQCLLFDFYEPKRNHNSAPFQIFYKNNSTTEFRSTGGDGGDSIAAKPYGYISYDEASRSHHLKTEIESVIIPRLTDWRGQLDITSTPDSDSPSLLDYYEMYTLGLDPDNKVYYTQEGSLFENTFLSADAIAEQIAFYANKAIAPQVLHGKFVFGGAMIFHADDILAAKSLELNPPVMDGMSYVARPYQQGHRYIIAVDTAMGSDSMVYTVLDVTDLENIQVVAKVACQGNSKSPQVHMMDFVNLFDSYNQGNSVKVILETWNGESARFYLDMPRNIQRLTRCYGSWQPPTAPGAPKDPNQTKRRLVQKADLIVEASKALAARQLKYPAKDEKLTKELSIYKEDDAKIPTDHVMSLALGVYLATAGKPKIQDRTPVAVSW
jgi:hypothetical protein